MLGTWARRVAAVGGLIGLAMLIIWAAWPEGSATDRSVRTARETPDNPRAFRSALPTATADPFALALSISGRVLHAGAGIAEATVCARCAKGDCEAVRRTRRACAVAGPEGQYQLTGLSPARYALVADHDAYLAASYTTADSEGVDLRPAESLTDIDFDLEPGGVLITGTIRDQLGGVIAGARVAVRNDLSPVSAPVFSDANGRYQLWVMPGEIGVDAEADGYVKGHLPGTAPGDNLDVVLLPAAQIFGTVVIAGTDQPLADLPVLATASWWNEADTFTETTGAFVLSNLAPGRYRPTVISDGWYGQSEQSIEVGVQDTVGPIIIQTTPAVAIFGRVVVGDDERPCANAWVCLRGTSDALTRTGSADDDGAVQIGSVLAGTYAVEVSCPGFLRTSKFPRLVVQDADLHDLRWALPGGEGVTGTVRDVAGRPAERYRVELTHAESGRSFFVFSNPLGKYSFHSQAEGSYELYLTADPDHVVDIQLIAGVPQPPVDLVAPAAGAIKGRLRDEHDRPVTEFGVTLRYYERQLNFIFKSEEGLFAMEGMASGTYLLQPTHPTSGDLRLVGPELDQGKLRVEVQPGETTFVEARVEAMADRIAGVVLDPAGDPVADAVVTARRHDDAPSGFQEDSALTDEKGRFEIRALAQGGYGLRADRAGIGEAVVEGVSAGEEVTLRLAAKSALDGEVRFRDGQAPTHFEVAITGDLFERRESFTHTGGHWTIDGVPYGEVAISVEAAGQRESRFVSLTPDRPTESITVVLEPLVIIRGVVLDAETDAPIADRFVRIRFPPPVHARNASTVTGADGRFELAIPATESADLVIYSGVAYRSVHPVPLAATEDTELPPVRLMPTNGD